MTRNEAGSSSLEPQGLILTGSSPLVMFGKCGKYIKSSRKQYSRRQRAYVWVVKIRSTKRPALLNLRMHINTTREERAEPVLGVSLLFCFVFIFL